MKDDATSRIEYDIPDIETLTGNKLHNYNYVSFLFIKFIIAYVEYKF